MTNDSNISTSEPSRAELKKKLSKMESLQQGTKRSSEALGISLSVILAWVSGDIMGWQIPNEVMAAFLTLIGIVATRLKKDD